MCRTKPSGTTIGGALSGGGYVDSVIGGGGGGAATSTLATVFSWSAVRGPPYPGAAYG